MYSLFFFFFNDTATTEIYTLSLHDALPISGGAAGAAANIPTYAQGGGAGGGNSNYQRAQESTKMGVGKTVTRTRVAPGAVNRLNVALMVDPSVPAATRTQLQTAIERSAGIDNQRGDQIDTSVVPFNKVP